MTRIVVVVNAAVSAVFTTSYVELDGGPVALGIGIFAGLMALAVAADPE